MTKTIFWIVSLTACAMAIFAGMQAADYACQQYPNVSMDFAIGFAMSATALFIGLFSNPQIFPHVFKTRGLLFRILLLAGAGFALMILSFPMGYYIHSNHTPRGLGEYCS
jgi:hypothetical protein